MKVVRESDTGSPYQQKSPPVISRRAFPLLFNFARPFFTVALAGECFFRSSFFTWFQVERMPLDLFNDVFLLYFTFKPSQSAFERLAILQMDFCQLEIHHLPKLLV